MLRNFGFFGQSEKKRAFITLLFASPQDMPSIKRKASSSYVKTPSGIQRKSKRALFPQSDQSSEEENGLDSVEDDEDDFDDGEDLMARAVNGDGSEGEDFESGEEDDDEEMEDEDEGDSPRAQDGQPRKRGLHAVPTSNEMEMLKNTSELFKSNIFKLKVSRERLLVVIRELKSPSDRRNASRDPSCLREVGCT